MSELSHLAYEVAARSDVWPILPILMADTDSGEIVYASANAAGLFGYTPGELLGQKIEAVVPPDVQASHVRWRQDAAVPKTRLMGVGRQILGRRKDGSFFPVHVGLTAMKVFGHTIGVAFIIDLTGIVSQSVEAGRQAGAGEAVRQAEAYKSE